MRRSEIIEGINQISRAIDESNIIPAVEAVVSGPVNPERVKKFTPSVLRALKEYVLHAQNYNSAAKEVTQILDLAVIENEQIWSSILGGEDVRTVYAVLSNLRFASEHLPQLASLIEQTSLRNFQNLKKEGEKLGMKVLSVSVFEEGRTFSSPARLSNVLESIDNFYSACALMEGESPSSLSVVACDSGSDKSFDFLGLAKVMECVERLIGTIWDRLVFYKERQFDERLELVTKSLPIIEQINKMEEQKQIDPALAEILRRNIFEGANKFIQTGATIPQLDLRAQNPPRSLLSPVQKLLVSAPAELISEGDTNESLIGESEEAAEATGGETLTPDEQKELLRLLRKTNQSKVTSLQRGEEDDDSLERDASENID